MMAGLSLPLRRFLALALLAVFMLVLWVAIISPLADVWSGGDSDEAVHAARLLADDRASLAEEPHWRAYLQSAQQGAYADLFMDGGGNPDVASAKLQGDVKRITESASGVVRSIQILPPVSNKGLQIAAVRISFSIPAERLATLLAHYDRARPYLFLDNLSLVSSESDPNSAAKPAQIVVTGDVFSYMKPGVP